MSIQIVNMTQLEEDLEAIAGAIRDNTNIIDSFNFKNDFINILSSSYCADDILLKNKPTGKVISNANSFASRILENRKGITELELTGNITSLPEGFTNGCSQLRSITITNPENITSLGNYTFYNCSSLTSPLFFPNASPGTRAFSNCRAPIIVIKDVGSGGPYNQMSENPNLEIADIVNGKNFPNLVFNGDSKLTTIILRKSTSIMSLSSLNVFTSTPYASGGKGGIIYIPESLYNHLGDGSEYDYQSATNWATLHGYGHTTWAKIEGSFYETHYGDGTPIPTLQGGNE